MVRGNRVVMALVACIALASAAQAAVTIDREYRFGDDPQEFGAAGILIGSGAGNVNPTTTLDSSGSDLATFKDFQDLANPAVSGAIYVNVGPTPGLGRPGAAANSLGASFDGAGDYLFGARLGYPSTTVSSTGGAAPGPGPHNYNGLGDRGFQLWVRPAAAGNGTTQSIVLDTNQHGVRINNLGRWVMRYNGADAVSTTNVAFDQWSHVMVVRPYGAGTPNGSILYVNGVAIAASPAGYNVAEDFNLVIGANTGATIGTTDYFNGVVDQMTMFVSGTTVSGNVNRGRFNFGTDNGFATLPVSLGGLTGVAGDVNQDGFVTSADSDDLIANWMVEKRVNTVRTGDITTVRDGDLNFDGITDLSDAFLLHQSLLAATGVGLDFSLLPVPEPSALVLGGLAFSVVAAGKRMRCLRRR